MAIKDTGSYGGKSNKLGEGGRAAQMKAQGVPGGVIGNIARKEGAAPGGPNYHRNEKKKSSGASDRAKMLMRGGKFDSDKDGM